jgi:hypothetical protein
MKNPKWVSLIALTGALVASLIPAASVAAAPARTNSVLNTGTVGIGAIELFDGSYKNGHYDDIIPGGRHSGYSYTPGFYIGSGYCVRVRGWGEPGSYGPVIYYSGQRILPSTYSYYEIRAVPSNDPLCRRP